MAEILTPEAYALLEAIADGESEGAYNKLYGGKRFSTFTDHPRTPVRITSGPNKGKVSTAAGKYQMLASTWDEAKKALGLKDFSPASQDAAAWYIAQKAYRGDLQADLAAGKLPTVAKRLSGTWTSLPHGIERGRSLDQFTAKFNQNVARRADLVPPADIPETAVASALDVKRPAPVPMQKPDAIRVAQASFGQDALQTALERYAAQKAGKMQAPNTTIPATVDQMDAAKDELRYQLTKKPLLKPSDLSIEPAGAAPRSTTTARQNIQTQRTEQLAQRPLNEPRRTPTFTVEQMEAAKEQLRQSLGGATASPAKPLPSIPARPTARDNIEQQRAEQQSLRPAPPRPPQTGVQKTGGTVYVRPDGTETRAPLSGSTPMPPGARPSLMTPGIARVTPEGLNVRSVPVYKVDSSGKPIVTPASAPAPAKVPSAAPKPAPAKTSAPGAGLTEAQKRAMREVAPSAFNPAPAAKPAAKPAQKPSTVYEVAPPIYAPGKKGGVLDANGDVPSTIVKKTVTERLPAGGPPEFVADPIPKVAPKPLPKPVVLTQPKVTLTAPRPMTATPEIARKRAEFAAGLIAPQPMVRPQGGGSGRQPIDITVRGGNKLVPDQSPALLNAIVSALSGKGNSALQQQASAAMTPAGGWAAYDRANPGPSYDVFGNDLSFQPRSSQESTRARTGY